MCRKIYIAWEEGKEQCEGWKVVLGARVMPRSQKEDIHSQTVGDFILFWDRPGLGTRVWFSAHQVMDDVGQGPDNRNAEERDAE